MSPKEHDRNKAGHMVRVLHVTGSVSRNAGGLFQSVRRVTQEIQANGWSVAVVGIADEWSEKDCPSWAPIQPHILKGLPVPLSGWAPSWARVLSTLRPEILHIQGLWSAQGWIGGRWCRKHKRPYIVSPRGMLEPWALSYRRVKKRVTLDLFERRLLCGASCVHATAMSEAESIRAVGYGGPIAVIPNGVDIPELSKRPRAASDERVAVFISRVHPIKGLPMLLRAWRHVLPRGWRLIIAGPDEQGHTEDLKKLSNELGLDSVITLCGPVYGEDKEALFARSDVFILPTYSENFGIAIAEALARAVPVITTTGAPWAMLHADGAGWWVPPTTDGIAEALRSATEMPAQVLSEMGVKGRVSVAARFGWAHIARQLCDVYLWILGHRARPDCVLN